jgi:hypothetical protein
MLRALIDLLRADGAAPGERFGKLLAWARGAASAADLELDLRTAMAVGVIDGALAGSLLAELDAPERGDATLAVPELEPLAAEVTALEAAQASLDGCRRRTLELRDTIAERARQLIEVEQRIAQLAGDVAAAEARCQERQAQLEGSNDERHQPVLV